MTKYCKVFQLNFAFSEFLFFGTLVQLEVKVRYWLKNHVTVSQLIFFNSLTLLIIYKVITKSILICIPHLGETMNSCLVSCSLCSRSEVAVRTWITTNSCLVSGSLWIMTDSCLISSNLCSRFNMALGHESRLTDV